MSDLALGPCPVLVERDRELTELSMLAATASEGSARLALLTGEAGAGKTRLWSEFADTLPSGWQFDYVGGQNTDRSYEAPFEGIVGEVTARGEPARALGAELARALRDRGGGDAPRLFVVEDLHFLDPVAVGALRHALSDLRSSPVLVVASYRLGSHPVGTPHSRAVAELLRYPAAHELRLASLSASGVAQMAEALGTTDAADLYERTQGNPFFVEELTRSVDGPLPWTIRESVAARLEELHDETRWVAEVLAVSGRDISLSVIEELDSTGTAARELVGGMLAIQSGDRIRLRHALVGDALASALTEPERRDRHRRLAMALDSTGGAPLEERARQWAAAGELQRAAPIAGEAADRLNGRRSHHTALELYRIALAYPPADALERAGLLDRAAACAGNAGDDDLAGAWAASAHEAEQAGGVATVAFSNQIFQRIVRQAAEVDEAVVEDLSKQLITVQDLVREGSFAKALVAAEATIKASAEAGDRGMEIDAGLLLAYAGALDRGADELERIAKEAEADDDLVNAANALFRRGRVGMAQGRLDLGLEFANRAMAIARRAGGPEFWASVQMHAAFMRVTRGDLVEAQHLCDEMIALERPLLTELGLTPLIVVAIYRGDAATARQRLDQVLPLTRAIKVDTLSVVVFLIGARVALLEGNLDDAVTFYDEAATFVWSPVQEVSVEMVVIGSLLGRATGDRERLATAAVRAADLARSVDGSAAKAAAEMTSGALATFEGRHREAAALHQHAAALWARAPRWPLAAESLCDLAEARLAAGEGDPSVALDEAESIAARFGFGGVRARVAGLRAKIDANPIDLATHTDPALTNLSDRERDIVRLVAAGKSNRDIGDELYLSEKTVRNYLSRIYDRVGVHRRAELASLLDD